MTSALSFGIRNASHISLILESRFSIRIYHSGKMFQATPKKAPRFLSSYITIVSNFKHRGHTFSAVPA